MVEQEWLNTAQGKLESFECPLLMSLHTSSTMLFADEVYIKQKVALFHQACISVGISSCYSIPRHVHI